jgi:hypothetical protein
MAIKTMRKVSRARTHGEAILKDLEKLEKKLSVFYSNYGQALYIENEKEADDMTKEQLTEFDEVQENIVRKVDFLRQQLGV